MTDRFTKAVSELSEKNAYVCDSCGHEATGKSTGKSEGKPILSHERVRELGSWGDGMTREEIVTKSDPTPFGV